MNLWQKVTIGTLAAAGIAGGAAYMNGCGHKEAPKPIPIAVNEPAKKVDDITIPEPVLPKVEPKVEPKEEPKVEPPKYEPKPVVFKATAVFENPVTYAIAMEQWRVEVAYRKITGEPVLEDDMTKTYRFVKVAGKDNVVQRAELKTSDLEAKVEERKKTDNKPYNELNLGSLSISDKTEYSSSIAIIPADEAQEKRLYLLVEHKTPEQEAYTAGMMNHNSKESKISNEKLDYVEMKVAEKYGGKK
jgi:hypothetical protein